ncbi:DUF616 domain-containing protein [Chlorobaculum sp. 24CR]|nr:DUF616 domain-containing protein [Chlorobaculum sp. 24CR]
MYRTAERRSGNHEATDQALPPHGPSGKVWPDGKHHILRRHNQPNIIRFSELWWQELQRHSKRDQLSFAYVARNEQLEYALLPGTIRNNDHFEIHAHKHKKTPAQKLLKSLKKTFSKQQNLT